VEGPDRTLECLLQAIRVATSRPGVDWAEPPQPLSGGFWAQTWWVRLAESGDRPMEGLDGELVARVMPAADVAAREIAVQSHLSKAGYPTPAVRLAGEPGPHLDRAWMLMDRAPGRPLLAALARWLARSQPASNRFAICHGDLHPLNILTHSSGDTVIDWSATQITDPAYDIAYTQLLLGNPPLEAPRVLRPAITIAGRVLSRRFTRTYERLSGSPVEPDQLAWYATLHTLRIFTEVATWRAQGQLDQHRGHPFWALLEPLGRKVERTTGITLAAS
jgi:aminoglycoside phosphotransferase (APT) family kinase protein